MMIWIRLAYVRLLIVELQDDSYKIFEVSRNWQTSFQGVTADKLTDVWRIIFRLTCIRVEYLLP